MPSEITHWAISSRAVETYRDCALKKAILDNPNLYALGAVIPDTPYYKILGHQLREIRAVADTLHGKNGNDTFDCLRLVFSNYPAPYKDNLLSFLLGFVTHLVIDSVFHPYVIYFSGTKWIREPDHKGASIRHFQFEAYLDLHFLETYKPSHDGLFKHYFHHKEMKTHDFVKLISWLFFGNPDFSWLRIEQTLRMHCRYQSLFMKDWPVKLMKSLSWAPGIDFRPLLAKFYPSHEPVRSRFFSERQKYRHPVTGERLKSSVADLEKESVKLIHKFFDVFRKNWADEGILKKLAKMTGPNASAGIAGATMNDLKYFDLSKSIEELVLGKKFI